MKMKTPLLRCLHFGLLVSVLLGISHFVYAYVSTRLSGSGVRVLWETSKFPLRFQINDKTSTGTSNVSTGSSPLAAFKAALAAWQNIQTASIQFSDLQTTSVDSANSSDGINLLTMVDTATNSALFGSASTLALTRVVFGATTGKIVDTDIIFNPKVQFSTNATTETFDLQSVATHELGHALGADHATAMNATMFYTAGEGDIHQRFLSSDDIAFASFSYPNTSRSASVGSISGKVTLNSLGVFGASVTAVEVDRNLVYTALTDSDGSYTITGPISGNYVLYAEPLDGPVFPGQIGGGIGYYKNLDTTFRTTVKDQQALSAEDRIDLAVSKMGVDFAIPVSTASLNINLMGRGDPNSNSVTTFGGPVEVTPGESLRLFLGGSNTLNVASIDDITFLGTGLTIDRTRGIAKFGQAGIGVVVNVAKDAAPGPRTVLLKVGEEKVTSTGGVVVTFRSPPSRTLYLPYLFDSSVEYTGVALANPSTTSAAVRVTVRDNLGQLLYDPDAIIPIDLSIAGGTQTAKLVYQLFKKVPFSSQQSGSITVESDNSDLQSFFLTGDLASTYLDGADAFTRAYKQLHFVDILQNANTTTEIHLMNVKDTSVNVQLTLVGSNGVTLKGPVTRTIQPMGKIGETIGSIFGATQDLNSAHVNAVATEDALVGFEFIRQQGAVFGVNAQPVDNAAATLYSPQLAAGDFGVSFKTRLNLVNVGTSSATVSFTVLGDSGQILASSAAQTTIPAGGQFSLDAQTFFNFAGTRTQGSVKIVANSGAKLLGNVLFGDDDPTKTQLKFGAALPLSAVGTSSFIFSQVAQAQGFYTGVAFLALEAASLKVEVFNKDGVSSGSKSLSLAAGARLSDLLQSLIPATANQVQGFVKVTSDKPVIAFELFGDTNGQFLSAVPPQPIISK